MSHDGLAALLRGAIGFLGLVIVVFHDHTHLLFLIDMITGCFFCGPFLIVVFRGFLCYTVLSVPYILVITC